MIASSSGQLRIVQLLLSHNAKVNMVNNYGETALILASAANQVEIVQLLLQNQAAVHVQEAKPILTFALSKNCSYSMVEVLLSTGVNVNEADASNRALSVAAQFCSDTNILQVRPRCHRSTSNCYLTLKAIAMIAIITTTAAMCIITYSSIIYFSSATDRQRCGHALSRWIPYDGADVCHSIRPRSARAAASRCRVGCR